MNDRLRLWACQATRNSTVELWDSGGECCVVGLGGELCEIKRVDSAATRRAFWVDRPEEETAEFLYLCVCVCELLAVFFRVNDGSAEDSVVAFVWFLLLFLFFAFRGQTLKWINQK